MEGKEEGFEEKVGRQVETEGKGRRPASVDRVYCGKSGEVCVN